MWSLSSSLLTHPSTHTIHSPKRPMITPGSEKKKVTRSQVCQTIQARVLRPLLPPSLIFNSPVSDGRAGGSILVLERKSIATAWRLRVRCWGNNPVTQFPDPAPGAKETAWGQGARLDVEPRRPELSSVHNKRNQSHFSITAMYDWKWKKKKSIICGSSKKYKNVRINPIKYV